MGTVYYKTMIMVITIFLGWLMRRLGILQRSDARVISKILMNITLPCIVVTNINGITLDMDILVAVVIGILANAFFCAQAFIFSKPEDSDDRVVKAFCLSSFNVGNYVIPLLTGSITPHAMAGVLAYNYPGTAIFTYGMPPVVAGMAYGAKGESAGKRLWKSLSRNVTLLTCVFMITLSLLKLSLPESVVGVCRSIGGANATLAMLSIGLLLDLNMPKEEKGYCFQIVAIRFACAVICGLCIYFFAPVADDMRRALTLTVFAPIASTMPALALSCGYNGSRVAVINSLYMIVSVVSMTLLTLILY